MKALIPTLFCLAATILLVLATISVPIRKNFYFLEATVSRETFYLGALGYCVGSQCSNVSVGYDIRDAATLIGTNRANSILSSAATSVLRGLTYTLVLHPVAAGLSAVAMLLAILSFCAFGMGCLGTFVAGVATTVSLVAFAIDMALFTIIKKRVESAGGTASYGSANWLVLAAFICLIIAQFAFCCACCGSRGGGSGWGSGRKRKDRSEDTVPDRSYGDRMRMDALDAEAARKARANGDGTGRLPQFAEYEHEVPLKNDYDEPYHGRQNGASHNNVGYAYDGVDATHGGGDGYPHQNYTSQHNVGNGGSEYGGYGGRSGYNGSSYVPGVGPGYGNGAGVGSGSAAAAAAGVAGVGAAGAAYAHHHNHDGSQAGYGQATDDYANYGHGADQSEVGGYGGSSQYQDAYQNQHQDGYGSDPYDQQQQHNFAQHDYAPSVTSGYAVGGPSSMAMPQPVPARNAATPATDAGDRRRPTQDDGFGLSALEASAAAAAGGAGGAAAYNHYHNNNNTRQQTGSEVSNNGMYYDATSPTDESAYADTKGGFPASESMVDPQHQQGGHNDAYYSQQYPEEWQHSTRTNDFPNAGGSSSTQPLHSQPTGQVPSYDYAIGAISPDEERARSQQSYGFGGGSSSTATSPPPNTTPSRPNTRGPLPIPGSTPAPTGSREMDTPGYSAGNSGYGNGYPREKY